MCTQESINTQDTMHSCHHSLSRLSLQAVAIAAVLSRILGAILETLGANARDHTL